MAFLLSSFGATVSHPAISASRRWLSATLFLSMKKKMVHLGESDIRDLPTAATC
jgi:hypothetical protein